MRTRIARCAVAVTAAVSIAILGACAPSAGGGAASEESGQSGTGASGDVEVSTDISDVGDYTLTVWDQEVRGGQNEQMEQLNKAFMEKYPNITINRVSQSFDDLQTTLRLALTGDDAPDVVEANNGRNMMGQFVAAGQLVCLDPWAEAYGWGDEYSESILQYSSYSSDATDFGTGCLYGLPQMGEAVGIYYSKAKLAQLGLDLPTTWEAFGDQLGTIKDAGETPLMLGNVEKWPGLQDFGVVLGQHADAETVRTLGFGNAGASWDADENLAAATELQDWAKAGYFNDGFNGVDYDTVWQDFAQGTGAYLIAGSWLAPDLADAMGDDVGFVLPPSAQGMDKAQTIGGTSLPFAVTSASKNPNVAAAYIDFITNADAMKVLADTGNVPVNDTATYAADQTGVVADVMNAFASVSTDGNILPYLDYATPTFDQVAGDAVQGLLDQKSSPQEFLDTLEQAYTEFTGQ
ncbi:ABC transporter substrate-binding protein [Schaalia naturae]|jgi:raffinose/stachyose/melibiose transport system substrate-binding protein|uniref:ABC transporter substrate-binding protein n=1 Tax=Schaalia naturae TaxID=635203 RepID=A0ABW2SNG7_9ACTO